MQSGLVKYIIADFALLFGRSGATWSLSFIVFVGAFRMLKVPIKWERLCDAPLRIKIAAAKVLPDLLFMMQKSQEDMIKELNDATGEAERLITQLENNKTQQPKVGL